MTTERYDNNLNKEWRRRQQNDSIIAQERRERLIGKFGSMSRALGIIEGAQNKAYAQEHHGGYCPKCFCLRTYAGRCVNGCDDE